MEKKYHKHGHGADFDSVSLRLASPEKILEWSYGEVTKPETINYRTQRSEKGGLFDEKIFGPEKDFECYCGKYRGIRYKGIICEKCGVEVTRAIVRRERMGHIELASPVSHVWFLRSIPSRMGMILNLSAADLERVIYFAGYIVTNIHEDERKKFLKEVDNEYKTKVKTLKDDKSKEKLKEVFLKTKKEINGIEKHKVLDSVSFNKFSLKYGPMFEAQTGAEAVFNIFKELDLKQMAKDIAERLETIPATQKPKFLKRQSLIASMLLSGVRPEWMFMIRIPVIPPAIRPMVALDGGRHATSDVNDLYRRVINRNNRLKKLIAINAPNVILRNEKRILQEAVDALIDNSIKRGQNPFSAMSQAQRRPLKSLADNLKGKQGLFRQNLLGKRVDYSGRSVIVVGPELSLDQCGLPKHMALELFRPFVVHKLLLSELAFNIRGAGRLIDEGIPEVWAILEDIIRDKHVLLNRAPTLHRLGIQAFRPILIEGNAIQVHPLVCTAFNADFDGDQMAVHVPLSDEAQLEAREIMSSRKNLLKPGDGKPVGSNKMLDIILGCFWMTKIIDGKKGEGKFFPTPNNALLAYDFDDIDFRARIKVIGAKDNSRYDVFKGEIFETSAGRLLFNSILPKEYPYINEEVNQKKMSQIVDELLNTYGADVLPEILDKIKNFGFKYVTESGITWGIDDVQVPEGKTSLIKKGKDEVANITAQYNEGLLSDEERNRRVIEIWSGIKNQIEDLMPQTLGPNDSVHDMVYSGARGSFAQITQMAGMKGLINNPKGETVDFPIISSSKEGFSPIEYFISTHGSRKGMADTALGTAKAGYLTRRLFDVAQDVIVLEDDCKSKEGIYIKKESASGIEIPLSKNIKGRFSAEEIKSKSGKIIVKRNTLITEDLAKEIEETGLSKVLVRSVMTCQSKDGICSKCYGVDLGDNKVIAIGETVGTVAAQAIGEPGTQLTMRTFHSGGIASVGGDITQGLPRVEEIFERRNPKNSAIISHVGGKVIDIKNEKNKEKIIVILPNIEDKSKGKKEAEVEYKVHFRRYILIKVGDEVEKGQIITDGSANLKELFKFAGKEKTEEYIIHEINKIYELQGASVSRKHIEIIVRQMFSRSKILDSGDSNFSIGDVVENNIFILKNKELKDSGKTPAKASPLILGITEVSLSRQSFLSAASFQHTNKILIDSAVRGSNDELLGLKENIIIGRLIPAGSGFEGSHKHAMIEEIKGEEDDDTLTVGE
ncbi:DNA-directed RNA polymerase subunit beta' [Candidatus Campbellbacteria bacterium CG11_big_fil_rev_8_21_14_0_20_44_21]|uniref:DNA-directed RNA polymerase subunit beta' n=1 Tax=Candidatus Campbellbacteria bacterium CG22_combo_CG10-13_8_21_14_all_43_18 TaxID=1974530 RepID=A0A2H0DVW7_9BACT|nr:MAG: DNA-directed RNA polymerase subunit beta' [Candidatus Campbellbacteria bacterium CG22_combo_CG10-13_8_21_14_all_43_18]PIR24050.1 MAG: DNA-directed RNA polymerase subunit beta' [Candidatus Campbellbacteria bacterium CG11_big_fil_rev_8_21_14_0_20_44_21]